MKKFAEKRVARFVLVHADDWEALYVDGKCVEQHHHVDLIGNLQGCGISIEEVDAYNDPGLEDGRYPDLLGDVKID